MMPLGKRHEGNDIVRRDLDNRRIKGYEDFCQALVKANGCSNGDIMGKFLTLILALMLLPALPVRGADALTGTVVSVDQGRGHFHLQPDQGGGPVRVRIPGQRFPSLIQPGRSVTVWGNWEQGHQKGVFMGRNVTPDVPRHRRGPDPTGVRSRLFRDR